MEFFLFTVIGILTLIIVLLLILFFRKGLANDTREIESQVKSLNEIIDYKLSSINQSLRDQLNFSNQNLKDQHVSNQQIIHRLNEVNTRAMQKLTDELMGLKETNTQVLNLTDQISKLSNILNNSKKRGILGEIFLENLLNSVLPANAYSLQFAFNDGTKVDAVIFFNNQIIPIDAKFSLEKYNLIFETHDEMQKIRIKKEFLKDVRKRIDETSKYIKEEENTSNVALMFIPADGVYSEILQSQNEDGGIVEYAFTKNVILVSPITFYAYLQTLLMAMRNIRVQDSTISIIQSLKETAKYSKTLSEELTKLGKNLNFALSNYANANEVTEKLSSRIDRITLLGEAEKISE